LEIPIVDKEKMYLQKPFDSYFVDNFLTTLSNFLNSTLSNFKNQTFDPNNIKSFEK
jgi:hypothetical protein